MSLLMFANETVTIEYISSTARTSSGGSTPTYTARHTDEPCQFHPKTAIEVAGDGTQRHYQEANIHMVVKTVSVTDRAIVNSKYYDILSVVDKAGKGKLQTLRVRLKE